VLLVVFLYNKALDNQTEILMSTIHQQHMYTLGDFINLKTVSNTLMGLGITFVIGVAIMIIAIAVDLVNEQTANTFIDFAAVSVAHFIAGIVIKQKIKPQSLLICCYVAILTTIIQLFSFVSPWVLLTFIAPIAGGLFATRYLSK
jgi:hypothetical protein